jgi:hypothetical protein
MDGEAVFPPGLGCIQRFIGVADAFFVIDNKNALPGRGIRHIPCHQAMKNGSAIAAR